MHASATPIINSQPVSGSNNTKRMPIPIPISTTPIVFFNAHNILLPPYLFIYYINSKTLLFLFMLLIVFYIVFYLVFIAFFYFALYNIFRFINYCEVIYEKN